MARSRKSSKWTSPRAYKRRRSWRRLRFPATVLLGAAAIGAVVGAGPVLRTPTSASTEYAEFIVGCSVTDGDTLRCQGERIRLLAIDAPELPGHCRQGRICAPGNPYASTRSLEDALTGRLTIERIGQDRYGRTLAMVAGDKGDLSCWQLSRRQAIYRADWDNGLRVARTCPKELL